MTNAITASDLRRLRLLAHFPVSLPAGQQGRDVDLDTLLSSLIENLAGALRLLSGLGCAFEAGGEPFLDIDEEEPDGSLR